jgi:hypothetical protein
LHCSPTRFFAVVSSNTNDRNAAARGSQLALQLQSIHAGHPYLNDQAGSAFEFPGAKKLFSRFKRRRSKAKRLDQQFCGPANGLIVVNDRD